jgi:hypothetical protein
MRRIGRTKEERREVPKNIRKKAAHDKKNSAV